MLPGSLLGTRALLQQPCVDALRAAMDRRRGGAHDHAEQVTGDPAGVGEQELQDVGVAGATRTAGEAVI